MIKQIDTKDSQLKWKFLFFVLGYFSLHVVLRVVISDSLDYDEAEQALLSQWLSAGYTEQPPLYTWIQYGVVKVFGQTVFSISLLKNTILFFTYASLFFCGEQLFKDTFKSVLSTSSLLLIPQIAWESQRDMTHTTLVVLAAAAVLWSALKLMEDRSTFFYVMFGIFCGIGFLSKANFALFISILVVTLLTLDEGRKVIVHRSIFLSLLTMILINVSYVSWMVDNQDIVFSATHKFKQIEEWVSIKGLQSFIKNLFLFLSPLWLIYLIFFPDGFKKISSKDEISSSKFMTRYILVFFCTMLVVIFAFKVSYVKDRWMQPMLFAAPLFFFSRVPRHSIHPKKAKAFLCVAATAAVFIYIGFTLRVTSASWTDNYCRLNYPFDELSHQIKADGFDKGVIISNNRFVVGNLLFKFPGSVALIPGYKLEKKADLKQYEQIIAVWQTDRSDKIPSHLKKYMDRICPAGLNNRSESRYSFLYKFSHKDEVRFSVLQGSIQKGADASK
jgi:4-amino-4-deoxy-L-arabinose transferase-like glycosyltransferase